MRLEISGFFGLIFFLLFLTELSTPGRTAALASIGGASIALDTDFAVFAVASVGEESNTASDRRTSRAVRRFERSLVEVQPLLERYGYWAAVAAVTAEGIGIPTPGQTLLMASALEAAEGRMNVTLLLFLVTGAAVVGNSIGYAIGRWGGRPALNKLKVNPQRRQHIEALFGRHGGVVILLARFVDGLRQLNGIVSGILRMPWWKFTVYNVAGALLWTCAWGLSVYYVGRDIHRIANFFHRHRTSMLALSVIAVIVLLVYLLRSKIDENK